MRGVPLAVLALLAACSPTNGSNESQSSSSTGGPAATLVLATGADCAAQWDGQSLSPKVLGDRAFALLSKRIDAAGGPAAITLDTMPWLRVEAPTAAAWPCAGEVLASLQHAGFGQAALRPSGIGDAPDQLIQLSHATAAPLPGRLISVGAGGAVQANGQPHDRPTLRDFVRANSSGGPDDFAIAPLPGASFGDVYQTLSDLRAGGSGVMLTTAEAGAAATPAMPPVPAVPER